MALAQLLHNIFDFLTLRGSLWLDKTNSIMTEIRDLLECFELNKFEGYHDENDIVQRGLDLISENKLWAGLVFTNVHSQDENLPLYIRYKIRMDASKVDSTKKIEDRISKPGPRRRPAIGNNH